MQDMAEVRNNLLTTHLLLLASDIHLSRTSKAQIKRKDVPWNTL